MKINWSELSTKDRIGISTHFLPSANGEMLEDAIDAVASSGISGLEIVPAEHQAQIGYPYNHPNVGLWIRELRDKRKKYLKQKLSAFKFVTIHSPHLDLNIASTNKGIRLESIRQYNECLKLAIDLDVGIVTFHMGKQIFGYIRNEDEIAKHEIEFGLQAAEFAKENGLKVGYEVTAPFNRMVKVIERTRRDYPEFGFHFDIGHAAMQRIDLIDWIEAFKDCIVEVHFNGVCHYWGGFMEHVPVNRNNVIDYYRVLNKLKEAKFTGPIVCELQGNDIEQAIEVCKDARDLIIAIWDDGFKPPKLWSKVST